jgi:DNA-directed RNA polymerase specialized sigma24 family protein
MSNVEDGEDLSAAEINVALGGLSEADQFRLERYAAKWCYFLNCEKEDLVQEAFVRLLNERKWPRNIEPMAVLIQTIRSVASQWHKRQPAAPDRELVSEDGEHIVPESQQEKRDPERTLIGKQDLQQVFSLFDDDPEAQTVAEGISVGLEGTELCELADISAEELATVRRRIIRRLATAKREGTKP